MSETQVSSGETDKRGVPAQEDAMGTIREKMTAELGLRGFASTTKKEYLQHAHNFIATIGALRQSSEENHRTGSYERDARLTKSFTRVGVMPDSRV
jgi:hypothetical protein